MLIPIDFDPKVKTKKRRNRIQSRINTLLYTNKENEAILVLAGALFIQMPLTMLKILPIAIKIKLYIF